MDWYRLTCWRCSSTFLDVDPGGYCIACAAPCIGRRGGQIVQHASVRVAPPPEPEPPAPLPRWHSSCGSARDEDGHMRICQWRLRSSTTGKLYTTRHKLTAETARRMDPDAVPVGEPSIIRGGDCQASTGDFMGRSTGSASTPHAGAVPSAGDGPSGWRDGSQHQWSRDPGRGRRYR
jgi:hypothetical protein